MWPSFIHERRLSLLAIAFTLAALLAVTVRAELDAEWLRDYALTPQRLQALYAVIAAVLVAVFAFEPALRRELADGKATALITAVGLFVSFFLVWIIVPDQQERWARFPLTIWFIIAHGVGLCAIVVRMATQHPDDEPTLRIARYARITAISLGLLLLFVHVISVGSFMRFDMPDEPWSASAATNFAATGNLNRTYNAGAYGDKDPTEARYYALMGLWIRAFGSDFVTMRAFTTMIAGVTVLIAAAAFWRAADMNALQKIVAVVALLGLSTFVRTSHELLQDVGTATYGALALLCWLSHERSANMSLRWPLLMGMSLYVGLETIPTLAPTLAFTLGLALIVKAMPPPAERRNWRSWRWQPVIIYGIGGAIAIAIFLFEHFTPDPTLKLEYFNRFTEAYGGVVRSRFTRLPWSVLYLPSNMTTSPVELLTVIVAVIMMLRSGTNADRWIGAILLVSLLLTNYFVTGAYSYLVMWSPFVAYLVGRACRGQTGVLVGVFVLLAGMVSAPILDMAMTTRAGINQRELAEVDLLTWRIPENSVVIGEDVFFYTLNRNRYFIGYRGLSRYAEATDSSYAEVLQTLDVDFIICLQRDGANNCPASTPEGFDEPFDFDISRGRYLVYQRSPA